MRPPERQLGPFLSAVPDRPRHRWQAEGLPTIPPHERMAWAREVPVESASQAAILAMLLLYSDAWGVAFPALATLARATMLDRSTVTRGLLALESAGLVEREKRRRPATTLYRLRIHEWRASGDPRTR